MRLPLQKTAALVCASMLLIVALLSTVEAMETVSSPTIKKMVHKKRLTSVDANVNSKYTLGKRDDWGVYDESYGMADAATGADSVYDLGQNCGFAPAWEVAGLPPPADYDPNACIEGGGGGDYESDGYDWSQADEEDYSGDEEVDEEEYDGDNYDTSDDSSDGYGSDPEPVLCVGICL